MSSITCSIVKTGKKKIYFFKSLDQLRKFLAEFVRNKDNLERTYKVKKETITEILYSVSYDNDMEKKIFQAFKIIPEDSEYYEKDKR